MISLIRAAWQEELRVPMFVGLSTDGYPDSDDPAMKNGARIYHMDTGSEYEYSIDNDAWYPVPSVGGNSGSGGMVVTANLIFSQGSYDDPLVVADKTYEEVLEHLMSGGNTVVNAVYEGDDRIYLMSFLGAKYNEITFVDDEGVRVGVNEDGWYALPPV